MKTLEKIPFTELEIIPQLIKDLLNGILPQFNAELFNLDNVNSKLSQKGDFFSEDQRTILVNTLNIQLENLELTEDQIENLASLNKENTFTITTGHQLNLFSGPVFFIYKILQTIKTANYLSKHFPDSHFVPIFWMATEDHDLDEIDHFKTQKDLYQIAGHSGGVVGKIQPENFNFISEFEKEFENSAFGNELISMMKTTYQAGHNLTGSTRNLVQKLFSEFGLLMIDGDDAKLKQQMLPIFKDELQNGSLKKFSADAVQFLEEKYGKVQVNPREINLFYLSETRDRIELIEDHYQIVDKDIRFSKEEMFLELQNFPERFSPNALMRPVFQESVLPNIAYIGGNAEIMYWLELKDYFKHVQLPFPILIPRNSFLMLKEKTVEKISKLDLKIKDIFKKLDIIIKDKLLDNNDILKELENLESQLKDQFSHLKVEARLTDVTFENLVEAEETRQLRSFDRMKKRLLRAEKIKQSELVERLESLYFRIHPSGVWQERIYNFSVFYADEGNSWLKFCLDEMPVEKPELVIAVV